MSTKVTIIAAIEMRVGRSGAYSGWKIGVTNDIEAARQKCRFEEGPRIENWAYWQANSLGDAEEIESRFTERGMRRGSNGDVNRFKPIYIWIC